MSLILLTREEHALLCSRAIRRLVGGFYIFLGFYIRLFFTDTQEVTVDQILAQTHLSHESSRCPLLLHWSGDRYTGIPVMDYLGPQ